MAGKPGHGIQDITRNLWLPLDEQEKFHANRFIPVQNMKVFKITSGPGLFLSNRAKKESNKILGASPFKPLEALYTLVTVSLDFVRVILTT